MLPDEEREISEADKERAMANEEQYNEENENAGDAIEENGERESEQQADDQDNETLQDIESAEQSTVDASSTSAQPKEHEIKEIESDKAEENPCLECGEVTQCKYWLLKGPPPNQNEDDVNDEDVPVNARPGIHYLCRVGCLNAFREANAEFKLIVKKVVIHYVVDTEQTCVACDETKICRYRFKSTDAEPFVYICEDACLDKCMAEQPDKFVITKKRFIIEELAGDELENMHKCLQCTEETKCKHTFKQDGESFYLCQGACLNLLLAEQPDRYHVKRQSIRVKVLPRRAPIERTADDANDTSADTESNDTSKKMVARTEDESRLAQVERDQSFCRRCAQCYSEIALDDKNLQWEAMDYCNESCLRQYQSVIGAACHTCQNAVSVPSMGKYCVRFGFELRQFCRSACLDTFKRGLKVCAHCQQDISSNSEVLARINGQFKDFCSRSCMRSYELIFNPKKMSTKMCAVCNNTKQARVEMMIESYSHFFCSNPCFSAFKFVNNINPGTHYFRLHLHSFCFCFLFCR